MLRTTTSFAVCLAFLAGCQAADLTSTGSPTAQPDPSQISTAEVATYRGDAARTGQMPGPGPSGVPRIAWQYATGGQLRSSAVVRGGTTYVVSGDGIVHALALVDGAIRWEMPLRAQASASPLLQGGCLIVGDASGIVHALDLDDGGECWSRAVDAPISGSAVEAGELIAVASSGGTVYALRPQSGEVAWSTPLGASVSRSIAAADGRIYVGLGGGTLVALNADDGSELWRVAVASDGEISTPAIGDGNVYVGSGLDASVPEARKVVALDAETGAVRWEYRSPTGEFLFTPAAMGGRAYVAGRDGLVVALDAGTGAIAWSIDAGAPLDALPSVADGVLYTATDNGDAGNRLVAVDVESGTLAWSVPVDGIGWAPTIVSGLVLLPTDAGTLYAVGGSPQ